MIYSLKCNGQASFKSFFVKKKQPGYFMKIQVYKAWKIHRFKDKRSEDLLVPSPGGAKIEIRLMGEISKYHLDNQEWKYMEQYC